MTYKIAHVAHANLFININAGVMVSFGDYVILVIG